MKKLIFAFSCLLLAAAAQAHDLKPWKAGPTPPLVLKDLAGKTHNLEDYRGKVVIVQFWATYCPPCLKEMPSVQRLNQKMAGKPFAILLVNMGETEQEVKEFLRTKVKVNLTVLMDSEGKSVSDWKVFVAPSSFIVDPQGKVRYTLQGGAEWDDPDYVKEISGLMAAK